MIPVTLTIRYRNGAYCGSHLFQQASSTRRRIQRIDTHPGTDLSVWTVTPLEDAA